MYYYTELRKLFYKSYFITRYIIFFLKSDSLLYYSFIYWLKNNNLLPLALLKN